MSYFPVTYTTSQIKVSTELLSIISLISIFLEPMKLTLTDRNRLMLLTLQTHCLQETINDLDWGGGRVAFAVIARSGRDISTFLGSCS